MKSSSIVNLDAAILLAIDQCWQDVPINSLDVNEAVVDRCGWLIVRSVSLFDLSVAGMAD